MKIEHRTLVDVLEKYQILQKIILKNKFKEHVIKSFDPKIQNGLIENTPNLKFVKPEGTFEMRLKHINNFMHKNNEFPSYNAMDFESLNSHKD